MIAILETTYGVLTHESQNQIRFSNVSRHNAQSNERFECSNHKK